MVQLLQEGLVRWLPPAKPGDADRVPIKVHLHSHQPMQPAIGFGRRVGRGRGPDFDDLDSRQQSSALVASEDQADDDGEHLDGQARPRGLVGGLAEQEKEGDD